MLCCRPHEITVALNDTCTIELDLETWRWTWELKIIRVHALDQTHLKAKFEKKIVYRIYDLSCPRMERQTNTLKSYVLNIVHTLHTKRNYAHNIPTLIKKPYNCTKIYALPSQVQQQFKFYRFFKSSKLIFQNRTPEILKLSFNIINLVKNFSYKFKPIVNTLIYCNCFRLKHIIFNVSNTSWKQ